MKDLLQSPMTFTKIVIKFLAHLSPNLVDFIWKKVKDFNLLYFSNI